ncbi:MAG TPA: VOC family protein [Chthonomonadaceae bacterium]|nr:VOC family protein [Chthonomonadaceae bacterium]
MSDTTKPAPREPGTNIAIGGGGFHHVAIRVFDFDASLKFYTEGLGFRRRYGWGADGRPQGERDSRAALLDTGDGNYLELFAGGARPYGSAPPEELLLHVAFRTSDTDAATERARQAGATVTQEPKSIVPAHAEEPAQTFRISFVRGLDGELIEFFQNESL